MSHRDDARQPEVRGADHRDENVRKVADLIGGIDIAMLTTIDESGALHSRPMYTQQAAFDGTVWFFTYDDSPKAGDVRRDPRVNLGYSDPKKQTYLSLAARAAISHDRAKMEELYTPALEAWFPQGLETPGICLLRVDGESAEYWDSPANPVAHLLGLVKAKTSGEPQAVGDNAVLELAPR